MKNNGEKEESVLVEILREIPEFRDPLKAVAEGAKEIMQK